MPTRERAIIYALLTAVLAVNAVILVANAARPALADPLSRTTLQDDLAVGLVDVKAVVERLLQTDPYAGVREELTQTINTESESWRARELEWQQRYADMTSQDDPRLPQAQAELAELRGQYQEWRNLANQRVNQLAVKQLNEAYLAVVKAVNTVSDRDGIAVVVNFTPVDAELPLQGLSGETMFEIRSRPLLRYPDGLDMTTAVLEEMNLPLEPPTFEVNETVPDEEDGQ